MTGGFDAARYGKAFAALCGNDRLCELGPGHPNSEVRGALRGLSIESAFAGFPVVDTDMAACCLSAVWLLHDYLDESHKISQSISSSSGSFWHGIMHRREGDFSNAKYWFRKVGDHAIFSDLADQAAGLAAEIGTDAATGYLASGDGWDPFRFVDACESVIRGRSTAELLCRRIARCEWNLLFDYCFRSATDPSG